MIWRYPYFRKPPRKLYQSNYFRHLASSPARLDPRHPAAAHPRRCKGGWSYHQCWDQTLPAFCIRGVVMVPETSTVHLQQTHLQKNLKDCDMKPRMKRDQYTSQNQV